MHCKRFFLPAVIWVVTVKMTVVDRAEFVCWRKFVPSWIHLVLKSSPRRWAGLSSGTAFAFTVRGDVYRPITSETPVIVYHGHGGIIIPM